MDCGPGLNGLYQVYGPNRKKETLMPGHHSHSSEIDLANECSVILKIRSTNIQDYFDNLQVNHFL